VGVAFSRDGKFLAGSVLGETRVWNADTFANLLVLPGGGFFIDFTPDNTLLAGDFGPFGAAGHAVRRWQLPSGKSLPPIKVLGRGNWSRFALSTDGRTPAHVEQDSRSVQIDDVPTGKPRFPEPGHTALVIAAVFHPDGKMLASRCASPSARRRGRSLRQRPN
jgi:WD40 repeat protein